MPRFNKLIVLDLDETLVFSEEANDESHQKILEQDYFRAGELIVLKRPNVSMFIKTLFEWFDVSVWTAGSAPYAHAVVSEVFGEYANCLKFIMTSNNTVWKYDFEMHEHRVVKPLKKVTRKGFELSKVLHIDNTPSTFSANYGNGILVSSWTGQQSDDELLALLTFLEWLGPMQDVRRVEKRDWRTRIKSWPAAKD